MTKFGFSRAQAAALAVALAGVGLGSCIERVIPPCPSIRFDQAAASITQFGPGATQDVANVAYQAEITKHEGKCVHDTDGEDVDVTLDIDFAIAGGPAAPQGPVTLYYYVAIPQFFPDPAGKRIIAVTRELPGGSSPVQRWTENNVRINIPLKEGQQAASFDIYIGFQLTDAQLAFNRQRLAPPP